MNVIGLGGWLGWLSWTILGSVGRAEFSNITMIRQILAPVFALFETEAPSCKDTGVLIFARFHLFPSPFTGSEKGLWM